MSKTSLALAAMFTAAVTARAGGVEQGVAEALGIVQKRGLQVDDAKVHQAVVRAVTRAADPLAEVYSPAQARRLQDEAAGSFASAGFRLGITNGLPIVIEVATDGSAAKSGIHVGDLITGIIGQDEYSALPLPDALRATRGDAGEQIELALRRGSATTNVVVTLVTQKLPDIEVAERLPNAILYIKVNGLYSSNASALASELRERAAAKHGGIILDLRDAGGDDAAGAAKVAGLFAKAGAPLFSFEGDADAARTAYSADGGTGVKSAPLMVLVDERTRGAAEILAAALADSIKGAMLVGETTAADPLLREFIPLAAGDVLHLATRKLKTPTSLYDGRTGIKPDVQATQGAVRAEYDAEPAADHRRALLDQELQDFALRNRIKGDAVLRRAVDILLGLKALSIGTDGSPGGS